MNEKSASHAKNLINILCIARKNNNNHRPSSDLSPSIGRRQNDAKKLAFLCSRELRYQNRSMVTRI